MGVHNSAVDKIRIVSYTASRLFIGAAVDMESPNEILVTMDDVTTRLDRQTYDAACGVARALEIRFQPDQITHATHILDLQRAAEDIYVGDLTAPPDCISTLFIPCSMEAPGAALRALVPSEALSTHKKGLAAFTANLDLTKALRYDVLWIQLATGKVLWQIAQKAQEGGVKVVYDFDDLFPDVPQHIEAAASWDDTRIEEAWQMIELADVVSVSTAPLKEVVLAEFPKKPVKVLPNHITATMWPKTPLKTWDEFRILWGGSNTHARDLAVVERPLAKFLESNSGAFLYLLGEIIPVGLKSVAGQIRLIPPVEFFEYPDAISSVGADVAIAPLEDNDFNRCKSDIKFLEYSACGYPSLMSPIGAYKALCGNGSKPGILCKSEADWEENLYLAQEGGLVELGKYAQNWVRKNRCVIATKAQAWYDISKFAMQQKSRK